LDSKTGGNIRVLNDGNQMSSDMTQVADFLIVSDKGTGFDSYPLIDIGSVNVVRAVDSVSAITLTASDTFAFPSYISNSYGSTARLEYVDSSNSIARVAGRVAYPQVLTPAMMSADSWYEYTSLPSGTGTAITNWNNSISGGPALSQTVSGQKANVQVFNTNYFGAEFDTVNFNVDRMSAYAATAETSFTYFLVFKKAANINPVHCAFGKFISPGGTGYKVQGIGFAAGQPVLFTGSTYDAASSSSVGTANSIMCGYYGGTYKGLRVNGTAISSYASTNTSFFTTANTPGYYLGPVFIDGGNCHDNNDVYAEVVAFDRALTLAEIQIVEGYLNNKFNLNALPVGHPYRTQPFNGDTLTQLYNEGFTTNDLIIESNRLSASSGKAETWVGMFEIGLNHTGTRNTAQGDNHAPLIAEFDVLVNKTISLMPLPITAKNTATANLFVDGKTKYIAGSITLAFATNAPLIPNTTQLKGSSTFSLNVNSASAAMTLRLQATAASKLQFFGGIDCDSPYGCLGTSEFPPDLFIRKSAWSLQPVACKATVTAALGRRITVDYVAITTQSSVAGALALRTGLISNINNTLSVSPATIKYTLALLGFGYIRPKLTTTVCLPDMKIIGPSTAKKKPNLPFPTKPDEEIAPGGVQGPGSGR
jgi:hypothetical protein